MIRSTGSVSNAMTLTATCSLTCLLLYFFIYLIFSATPSRKEYFIIFNSDFFCLLVIYIWYIYIYVHWLRRGPLDLLRDHHVYRILLILAILDSYFLLSYLFMAPLSSFTYICHVRPACVQQLHSCIVYTWLIALKRAGCHGDHSNIHPCRNYEDTQRLQGRNKATGGESRVHASDWWRGGEQIYGQFEITGWWMSRWGVRGTSMSVVLWVSQRQNTHPLETGVNNTADRTDPSKLYINNRDNKRKKEVLFVFQTWTQ